QWDEASPGFVEVDLVAHEGGNSRGDYAQTLDLTDVCSGWTELAAVKNKAQVWVFEALEQIRSRLPFPLLGLDSDNGGEFINHHLYRYCEKEGITFTRSRPLRKNDNCFVEQKNYSVVRRFVGYERYDSEKELEVLNQLYEALRLYVNFFLPSQKLREKIRQGSRVTKRYDRAQTPFRRLLASAHISKSAKAKLGRQFRQLNPQQLHRQILGCQEKLMAIQAGKRRAVEGDVPDGKAQSRFPTVTWKTPAEFPTPPTAPTAGP
ncbi:MAG: integrase catalytic domain-containing protein, partial [Acidobacteriota bacterium]